MINSPGSEGVCDLYYVSITVTLLTVMFRQLTSNELRMDLLREVFDDDAGARVAAASQLLRSLAPAERERVLESLHNEQQLQHGIAHS